MRILRKANSQVATQSAQRFEGFTVLRLVVARRDGRSASPKNSADRSMLDEARGATPGSSA